MDVLAPAPRPARWRFACVHSCLVACVLLAIPRAAHADASLVLVDATQTGAPGSMQRLRKVLDSRGLSAELPADVESALDRDDSETEINAIRTAYSNGDLSKAQTRIERAQARVLARSAEPLRELAELALWYGIVLTVKDQDQAERWFRAAHRFDPDVEIDKRVASPRMLALVSQASKENTDTGKLDVNADPPTARIAIDGGELRAPGILELPAGIHMVSLAARGRADHAELVDVISQKTQSLIVKLSPETPADKVARAMSSIIASSPGKDRLSILSKLAKSTHTKHFLLIEKSDDDKIVARIYDVGQQQLSRDLVFDASATSSVIAATIQAAQLFDDPSGAETSPHITKPHDGIVGNNDDDNHSTDTPWYKHWYVWAGVGAVAVVGIGIYAASTYSRNPTIQGPF